MTTLSRICLAVLAGALACAAHAQEAPSTVRIKARTNPGNLQYLWVFNDQKLLQRTLPAEPRMVDFTWRITFTGMREPSRTITRPRAGRWRWWHWLRARRAGCAWRIFSAARAAAGRKAQREIEFVGPLDAVTVVETARYLKAKD